MKCVGSPKMSCTEITFSPHPELNSILNQTIQSNYTCSLGNQGKAQKCVGTGSSAGFKIV